MAKCRAPLDLIAQALSHPGRRAIISRLARGTASSTDLARLLGIGLPALQKHLDLLRGAAVIASVKAGRTVTHTLRSEGMDPLADWIVTRKVFWENHFDALTDHLEDR